MRTVRAVVGYMATLGAATRKVTKVTGLGSGMLTAKGKEQLFAREIWVKPILFQRRPVGKSSGRSDLKILEKLGVRRRKQGDGERESSNPITRLIPASFL